jgi:hypothetical protein
VIDEEVNRVKGSGIWYVLGGLIIIAVVAVLVRPGSQTSGVVSSIGQAGGNLLTSAEGL